MGIDPIRAYPLPRADELPPARVAWRPQPDRAVLLIHDMQRYFTDRFVDGAPVGQVANHIGALRKHCAAVNVPVVYTAQPGGQSPAERGLLADFWGAGLPADPAAESIVEAIAPGPDDVVIRKRRYSAFAGTDLPGVLAGRDQLLITGVYAHIGVLATACDAFMRDIQAFVVADAVADFSAAHHREALAYAAARCAAVTSTEALLDDLRSADPAARHRMEGTRL